MKAQTPAQGILMTNDFGNSKWYSVVCGCGQPDHTIEFEVESSNTGVVVNTYASVSTDYWKEYLPKRYDIDSQFFQQLDWTVKNIINGLISKIKVTWAVWTQGRVRCQTTILMTEQQALNYAETLKSAIADVKEFKKESQIN